MRDAELPVLAVERNVGDLVGHRSLLEARDELIPGARSRGVTMKSGNDFHAEFKFCVARVHAGGHFSLQRGNIVERAEAQYLEVAPHQIVGDPNISPGASVMPT